MAIKIDGNRKTFRSDVKSRSGKRLPGLESHYQGIDLVEANINRCLLPIIGRDNPGGSLSHEYTPVNAVYTSVRKATQLETKRIVDVSLIMDPATATYNNGLPTSSGTMDFSGLVGQRFTILNPQYHIDNSQPQSWTFEFTLDQGIDPRRMLMKDGLYPGSKVAAYTLQDVGKHPMNIHSEVRAAFANADGWSHDDYQERYLNGSVLGVTNKSKLELYGAYNSSTGRYEIPLGLPTDTFDQVRQAITGTPPGPEEYDDGVTKQFIHSNNLFPEQGPTGSYNYWPEQIGQNTAWLYLVISRAIYNVLPGYISILEPSQNPLPEGIERGTSFMFWNKKNPNTLTSSSTSSEIRARNPLVIKLYYKGDLPQGWTGGINQTSGSDISVTNWDLSDPHEYVFEGYREIERDKHAFYEDFRNDYFQTTNFNDFVINELMDTTYKTKPAAANPRTVGMYGVQLSQGSSFLSNGDPIVSFSTLLSDSNPSGAGIEVVSELIEIHKTQKRDFIPNTGKDSFVYHEDRHFFGLSDVTITNSSNNTLERNQKETNWTYMEKTYKQFVDPADHGNSDAAAFEQHIVNFIDGNYARDERFSKFPMSETIDVLQTNRSFHENMPPSVLERTRGCAAFTSQYLDHEAIVLGGISSVIKYKKQEEEVGVAKFEDVRGMRRETFRPYFLVTFSDTFVSQVGNNVEKAVKVYVRDWHPHVAETPEPFFKSTGSGKWDDFTHTEWKYNLGAQTIPTNVFGNHHAIVSIEYVEETDMIRPDERIAASAASPAGIVEHNSVMFLDYFDQEEPDTLDFFEREYWSRIDDTMLTHLSQQYWNHDNNSATPDIETSRPERREWQREQYLYANTGHTTVHSEKVNGIISQEHKR